MLVVVEEEGKGVSVVYGQTKEVKEGRTRNKHDD